MTFDILDISEGEAENLETVQLKLLRTAQQKKNELLHKLETQLKEYKLLLHANGAFQSSLYTYFEKDMKAEYNRQIEVLKEQLIFNMSLKEPTHDGETGDNGNDTSGYLVDYELSYIERYIQVRDYYMAIENPAERLALYAADEVAVRYLGTYYNTLYNHFLQFTES